MTHPLLSASLRAPRAASLLAAAGLCLAAGSAQAHGFLGQRFFPATLATDDPFVADELSLPTVSSTRSNGEGDAPSTRETSVSASFARRITSDFGVEVGINRLRIAPRGQPAVHGWDNVGIGAKYEFHRDEARELLLSVGLDWDVGRTGSKSIGAERFSTFTPAVFFGKGFGDLSMEGLRPLAITGSAGIGIPTRASTSTVSVDPDTGLQTTEVERNPHVLQMGFALQYSLPYLQSAVKDVGLRAPFDRMVPVVEFTFAKPLDRVDDRRFTGTINPGLLWAGRKVQFGLEAVIPMNSRSGHGVGFIAQLHFFLDDLFPGTFGRPLIGSAR